MLIKFIERENEIFTIIEKIRKTNLQFVLIGGYAVSAYSRRFSVDADIVIKSEDEKKVEEVLKREKYDQEKCRNLENDYDEKFVCFIKKKELLVTVDLLVNSVASRQTGAVWGFDYLFQFSEEKKIKGVEKEIVAVIPEKEMLIALKLHAGRFTDIRDIVALCKDIDFQKVLVHTKRGNIKIVLDHIILIEKVLKEKGFQDSFKGVFELKGKIDENLIEAEKLIKFMKENLVWQS